MVQQIVRDNQLGHIFVVEHKDTSDSCMRRVCRYRIRVEAQYATEWVVQENAATLIGAAIIDLVLLHLYPTRTRDADIAAIVHGSVLRHHGVAYSNRFRSPNVESSTFSSVVVADVAVGYGRLTSGRDEKATTLTVVAVPQGDTVDDEVRAMSGIQA
jgi:hypothetical protein